jgi:hypothetical protein
MRWLLKPNTLDIVFVLDGPYHAASFMEKQAIRMELQCGTKYINVQHFNCPSYWET